MIQKQNKRKSYLPLSPKFLLYKWYRNQTNTKVTYHGRLSFCYRNDTETKQPHKSYSPLSSRFLLYEWYRNKTNPKVTYHGRLNFCYRNDTETKQTKSFLSMVVQVSVIGMIQKQNKYKSYVPWSPRFLL
jgi:hypothetical protein